MYIETKKDLRKQLDEAIDRSFVHFSKLFNIEKIIEQGEKNYEMAIITLDKIKKELADRKSN